ncbi:hypothetical protein F5X97DRAFT_298148 [Nemania serpens]|nr:hypothetical protein F5X97DRAFT_298148 [Nemania serpens]
MEKANRELGVEWQNELNSLNQNVIAAIQNVVTEESRRAVREHVGDKIKAGKPVQPSMVEGLSQDLQGIRGALQSFQDQERVMASEQQVLQSLYFDGIRARHHTIDRAHEETFQWIFNHTESSDSLYDRWLKKDSGTFFIYGKPGSGKSTLMKFIYHAPETKVGLEQSAHDKKMVMAHFFFWNAGSALQKSQEGLLRCLLYEILRRCRNLISLAKKTIGDVEEFESDQDRWTKEQLLEIYQSIVSNDISTRFCFFIDGLDEYQDSNRRPEDLIQTLRSLQSSPDIKLCVSSRPWPAFTEAFGDTEWVLKVEGLTRGDILKYISDKFNLSKQYRLLTQKNPEYTNLVGEVAAHANGVFLWVVLVVRDLREGFTNNDSVYLMRERLESFPKDLELFFQHMLNSVSSIYQRRMPRMFQTAVLSQRPLLLMFYSFLNDALDAGENLHLLTQNPPSESDIESRQKRMRLQLYAMTKGLLEVVTNVTATGPFFQLRVDFLHRTVRDFLRESVSVRQLFENSLEHDWTSTPLLACRTMANQIKLAMNVGRLRPVEILELVHDLFFFANLARRDEKRQTSWNDLEALLDMAEGAYGRAIHHHQWTIRSSESIFLGLAAQYDFQSYMARKLKNPNSRARLTRHIGRPVLDYALVPSSSGQGAIEYSDVMVELLLSSGANANEPYGKSTIWSRFIAALVNRRIEADRRVIVKIINVLVSHKAVMDKETIRKLKEILSPDEQFLVSGLSKTPSTARRAWEGIGQYFH